MNLLKKQHSKWVPFPSRGCYFNHCECLNKQVALLQPEKSRSDLTGIVFTMRICFQMVVYHLQKVNAKSGWKVNGTQLFRSFQWKISWSNETWTVGPVFPLGYSKRKFVFPFHQACELILGETILSAKQLLKKNSEKIFALGTVSGTFSGFKRRSPKKTFKFCSDSICYNANSLPECQNWHSESSISLGKHAPGPLTLLCTKRQFYIPLKCKKT